MSAQNGATTLFGSGRSGSHTNAERSRYNEDYTFVSGGWKRANGERVIAQPSPESSRAFYNRVCERTQRPAVSSFKKKNQNFLID